MMLNITHVYNLVICHQELIGNSVANVIFWNIKLALRSTRHAAYYHTFLQTEIRTSFKPALINS